MDDLGFKAAITSEYHQAMIDAGLAAQQQMAAVQQQRLAMMGQANAVSTPMAKPINKSVMVFEVEAVENGFIVRHAAGTLSSHEQTRKSIAPSMEEVRDIVSTILVANRMET